VANARGKLLGASRCRPLISDGSSILLVRKYSLVSLQRSSDHHGVSDAVPLYTLYVRLDTPMAFYLLIGTTDLLLPDFDCRRSAYSDHF
jgi:hypothetical protein